MKFIKPATKLPETNLNAILGHGGLSLQQMRNIDRTRHGMELLVPSVRRDNKAYYENLKDFSRERAGEYIARLHAGLRRNYFLGQNSGLRLYMPGEKYESKMPNFAFSDITAYATIDPELSSRSKREQINWGFLVVNACYGTRNLIHAETSATTNGEGSVDSIEVFNVETGHSYVPADYKLESEAHLYQTVDRIIDRLDFAVNHDKSRIIISELN